MATRCNQIVRGFVAAMTIAIATATSAQTLPGLPEDAVLPQGEGSPGEVTFSHRSHVDQETPACTGCHPTLFKMLSKETLAEGVLYHAQMDEGLRCGACHDGTAAFGRDDCTACHRME